jgi:hypothetical protein
MMTSSYHRSELADEHRRELLAQGDQARLAHAAQRRRRRARSDRRRVPAIRFPVAAQTVAPVAPEPIDQQPCPELAGAT